MNVGQYILDRWMVDIIRDYCVCNDIVLQTYSDNWLLELSRAETTIRIFGYKFSLNDATSTAIAGDKVAMYELLSYHGINAIEHRLVRTKVSEKAGWKKDLNQLVVKPLEGTSGHGIKLVSSPAEAEQYISRHPLISAWAASPYYVIEAERRFLVLDGKVLCEYEKIPVMLQGLKMFNLGLGAKAVNNPGSEQEKELALKAMQVSGLRVASVDIVRVDGSYKVLEINDGIMMENYMRQSESNKEIAENAYGLIIDACLSQTANLLPGRGAQNRTAI